MSAADQAVYDQALPDIERYRKGDLTIRLQAADGSPLPSYTVQFQQSSHDFRFGTGADPYYVGLAVEAGINSWTVLPGWWLVQPADGDYQLTFTDFWTGIDEISSLGLAVKTNDMFTPGGEGSYLRGLPFEGYLSRLDEHVSKLVRRFASSVDQWEAVLEPNYGNHNPYGWSHEQYLKAIATSIQAIREEDPTALVEINLSYPCGGIDWLNNYAIVEELLRESVDFDVLGLQLYYNTYLQNPPEAFTRMSLSEISACVDRYQSLLAPYGKSIDGSEINVPANAPRGASGYWGQPWSEDLQAQYLTTAYTILFAKQLNHSLTWWSFETSPGTFVYQGGLVDEERNPRKAYWALRSLIDSWTTNGEGVTDADGELSFRGFAGNYDLRITDPDSGARMMTRVHIAERDTQTQTIVFERDPDLAPMKQALGRLISFWEEQKDDTRVRLGTDRMALAEYLQAKGEADQAEQSLASGLEGLSITRMYDYSPSEFKAAEFQGDGKPVLEDGMALIWSGSTLYLYEDFPAGRAHVDVLATSHPASGVYPTIVIGIGGHFSGPVSVDRYGTYAAEFDLTGTETLLTVRFLYEDNSDPGEFKLYVQRVMVSVDAQDTLY